MFAAKKGDINLVNSILKYNPEVNAKDAKNRNALFYAISSNNGDNVELIISLLNSGINPNDIEYYIPTENIEGHSPLTLAAKLNYKNIMKALLQRKANPNHQVASNYNSCLHYAIINNNEEMINILIEARANINILNRDDITPINMALKGSNGIIYWKLAHENERLQIESEVSKMKIDSENINLNKCNINNLKQIINNNNKNGMINLNKKTNSTSNNKNENNTHTTNSNLSNDTKPNQIVNIKNTISNNSNKDVTDTNKQSISIIISFIYKNEINFYNKYNNYI